MKSFITKIYQFSLLVLLCWGAHAWFTWEWSAMGLERFVVLFVFIAISIIYLCVKKIKMRFSNKEIGLLFLWSFAVAFSDFKLGSIAIELCRFFPLLVLINDVDNCKNHLVFISKSLAIIIIPGILIWIIIQMNIMPYPGIPVSMDDDLSGGYYFWNYIFVLDRINTVSTRFQSIFLEPGYFATLIVFVLYANKYDWHKWYNWVMLVAVILSQSLAGYIIFVLGYMFYLNINKLFTPKTMVKAFIFMSIILIGLHFMQSVNNGDNIFYKNTMARFEKDNEKYIGDKDVRNSQNISNDFVNAIENGTIFWGHSKYDSTGSAGYKVFMLTWGGISCAMYLFVYWIIIRIAGNRKYGHCFLLLLIITFIQASYPQSYSWIIPFILGVLSDKTETLRVLETKYNL